MSAWAFAGLFIVGFIFGFLGLFTRSEGRKKALKQELAAKTALLNQVYGIATKHRDIDPSAELIVMKINEYENRRTIT